MMISVGVHFYLGSGWGWGGGGFFTLLPREFFMPRVVGLGGGLMFPYVAPEFVGGLYMVMVMNSLKLVYSSGNQLSLCPPPLPAGKLLRVR